MWSNWIAIFAKLRIEILERIAEYSLTRMELLNQVSLSAINNNFVSYVDEQHSVDQSGSQDDQGTFSPLNNIIN